MGTPATPPEPPSPSDISEETLSAFLNEFRPRPNGLSPDVICERTGIDPGQVHAIRDRLAQDGFLFEEMEDGRWRLANRPDRLHPYWIRAGLRCDRMGGRIVYQQEVDSTQDVAFELAAAGSQHGTLVVTDHQRGGRGRGQRIWHSNAGKSLLFSLVLDPDPPDTFASVLTIAIATSIARAVQDVAGIPARIKFPNDILVRGKKVAGVLLEVRDVGGTPRAVAGVGINVNQLREELHEEIREIATSLREERPDHEPVRRPRLLRYILRELEKWLETISQGDFAGLEGAWKRFSVMEGREVQFLRGTEEVRGRILEASIRGGLVVRLPSGEEKRCRLEHLSELRFLDSTSS